MPDKTIACLAIRVLARGEGANSEVDIEEASEGFTVRDSERRLDSYGFGYGDFLAAH